MTDELTFWRTIPLTKGQRAIVDARDYDRVADRPWFATFAQGTKSFYAQRRKHLMHREIVGAPAELEVDHINGDTLDNRRANLRSVTRRVNLNNRKDHGEYGPGIRYRDQKSRSRPFEARVFVGGKLRHVGTFATAEEARVARAQFLETHAEREQTIF